MMKKCILITGGTGFIGSHVVERFLSEGLYTVVAIVRKGEGYKNVDVLREKGALLVEGRFYDEAFIEHVFRLYPIEHVIHLAALRGAGQSSKTEYIRINVKGTEVLLKKSLEHEVDRFIFVSSVGVYGTIPKEVTAKIATQLYGDNVYHLSKIMAESKVHDFVHRGLDAYIVRPAIAYGEGDNGFPRTLLELVRKRLFLLPSKDVKVHLLKVSACAELLSWMIRSAELDQRNFIVADRAPISLKELVDLIYSHYHRKSYPRLLTLPSSVFKALSKCFELSRNEKWLTRSLLMSNSWHYDISHTQKAIPYPLASTYDSFVSSIRT